MSIRRRFLTAGLMATAVTVLLPAMSGAGPLSSSPFGSLSTGSLSGGSSDGACDRGFAPGGALDTPEQLTFERTVAAVAAHPLVRAARNDVAAMYRADQQGATGAGQATLDAAVDSITMAATQTVANHDPGTPQFVWTASAPRCWHGQEVARSGYGIDNPDNVHRHTAVDGQSSFVIRGRMPERRPAQLSFVLYGELPGTGAMTKEGAPVLASLTSDRMQIDPDGSFTITVDPEPADGRPNHIRTTASAQLLIARDSLNNWAEEAPSYLEIERTAGPEAPATRTREQLATQTADLLRTIGRYWLDWDNTFIYMKAANDIQSPTAPRGSGFGFATSGHFALGPRQALVVTLDPVGARYLGFELTDPWGVAREYVDRSGSLNQAQSRPNADGTITYVIAAEDPGTWNWLDTNGIDSGMYAIRWQSVPADVDLTRTVRSAELVDIADLDSVLPAGTTRVTPAQRVAQLDERAAHYTQRLLG
ncbi:DUF1214 domain-containing protein [Rhodococcus hoagii]|uniref:DUF1214 domain-containing protein n=1 Tax=Rhodococcus hoagii TaxID=43767 RepID=UPI000A0F6543|nr:DUF1214 domain-containing protein [Prescottella equi]MBM4525077.1 DUF1214 domain-containing protein [Prescottella equi]MBM4591633.1 DUF1214 domain-containing protein [Prescottella equi]MBM4598704.1 DUF1214 domain-containing protein [Prescottella equi]MBM4650882.1 DUF1214 domain-containing protein [Prescottella equi]MBM4686770.1 DUF1214 domain-containing protein [Prescottella equi]